MSTEETDTPEATENEETEASEEDAAETPKKRNVRVHVDNAEFVEFWQKSNSTREVAEHFGMRVVAASGKASYLRKKGVPLKLRGGGFNSEPTDFKALAKIAKAYAPEKAGKAKKK